MSKTQKKAWVGTKNNYNEEEYKALYSNLVEFSEYAIIGREIGQEGTRHLQIYFYLKSPQRLSWLKNNLDKTAHFETAKGTPEQNKTYCSKEGNYIEIGELPGDRTNRIAESCKKRWTDMRRLASEGKMEQLAAEYPKEATIYEKNFEKIRLDSLKQEPHDNWNDTDLKNHFWWISGPTGSGKSHIVNEIAKLISPNERPYRKGLHKWWNGYRKQRVIHIEEATPKAMEYLSHYFKMWADKWGFQPEVKNGFMELIVPEFLIVTSNYTLSDCFPNNEDYAPLQRRFKEFTLETREDQQQILDHFLQFTQMEADTQPLPPLALPELNIDISPDTNECRAVISLGNTGSQGDHGTPKKGNFWMQQWQDELAEDVDDPPSPKRIRTE